MQRVAMVKCQDFVPTKLSTFAVGLCSLQVEEVEFAPRAAEAETGCLNKAKANSRQVEFLLL